MEKDNKKVILFVRFQMKRSHLKLSSWFITSTTTLQLALRAVVSGWSNFFQGSR